MGSAASSLSSAYFAGDTQRRTAPQAAQQRQQPGQRIEPDSGGHRGGFLIGVGHGGCLI